MERLRAFRAAGGYERWQARTDPALLVLAVAFLGVIVLPAAMPELPTAADRALFVVNVAIWVVFTVDYVVRLYLAPERWRFVRTHLLDLAVILLPLLRPLRGLRVLRLARAGSLIGIVNRRAQRSLHSRVSVYAASMAGLIALLSAVGILDAERTSPTANIKTFPDALWWAATTVTTVGYGDRYPTTGTGRLIAVALMLTGIALLGVLTASIAAWFVDRIRRVEEAERRTEATLADVLDELRHLRDQVERREADRVDARPGAD